MNHSRTFTKICLKIFIPLIIITLCGQNYGQSTNDYRILKNKYIQLSGNLFKDVQLYRVFPDSKTFVDAIPKIQPTRISFLYDSSKSFSDFNLRSFVMKYFDIPLDTAKIIPPPNQNIDERIEYLWDHLKRNPDRINPNSTLLSLPDSYIVPGGRFREMYYWDTYFTLLGLLADGKTKLAEDVLDDFAYLIEQYGHIPNGNRIYYLTRSQPPFFALMVSAVSQFKDSLNNNIVSGWALKYLPALEEEYSFWMNGTEKINIKNRAAERTVLLDVKDSASQSVLNRYYDYDTIPREESYVEDFNLVNNNFFDKTKMYRNFRAAAESGWDFSSRWFKDKKSLMSCNTTDIIPVDLNCLLYFLEKKISELYLLKNDLNNHYLYQCKAEKRAELINKYLWDSKKKYYFDYNWRESKPTGTYSLAGSYPLYFGIASSNQAKFIEEKLRKEFLKNGGLITTLYKTKQQWDAPNGWAPLQWIAIKGLRNFNLTILADTIKLRWMRINEGVYNRTGKLFEKYNVEAEKIQAAGGEYPLQDGFGWTNGVYSALKKGLDKRLRIIK
jgi:alpha,alpha-trehalase